MTAIRSGPPVRIADTTEAPTASGPSVRIDEVGPATSRSGPLVRIVAVAVPLATLGWLALNWSAVDGGTDALATARLGLLSVAVAAACLTWVAGATCQQGSVLQRLPAGSLLAVQLAGSAANHVLPAGVGVGAVNLRYLRRRGLSRTEALNAVGLNTAAGVVVHAAAIVALVAVGATSLGSVASPTAGIAAGVVLAVLLVGAHPAVRRRVRAVVAPAVHHGRAVCRHPRRALQLWLGSAAVPVLHCLTLWFVARSLGSSIGVGALFGAYFLASGVSAAIPSPGGFGSLDAALTIALHAAGTPVPQAIATVLAYRLVTVWIPLLPSVAAIVALRRRAVL